MKKINRLMINICSEAFDASKSFYTNLFDFRVDYDSDWFIHLISEDKQLELGIMDKQSDLIPTDFQQEPKGFYLTFVVDDVDALYQIAQTEQFKILQAPEDTFYGQRRMLLEDPNGALIDISAPIPDFQFGN